MTFEQRVALVKPLSATEIGILQNFADGPETAEIAANRNTTATGERRSLSISSRGM